jgi:hypothetical protein
MDESGMLSHEAGCAVSMVVFVLGMIWLYRRWNNQRKSMAWWQAHPEAHPMDFWSHDPVMRYLPKKFQRDLYKRRWKHMPHVFPGEDT